MTILSKEDFNKKVSDLLDDEPEYIAVDTTDKKSSACWIRDIGGQLILEAGKVQAMPEDAIWVEADYQVFKRAVEDAIKSGGLYDKYVKVHNEV